MDYNENNIELILNSGVNDSEVILNFADMIEPVCDETKKPLYKGPDYAIPWHELEVDLEAN